MIATLGFFYLGECANPTRSRARCMYVPGVLTLGGGVLGSQRTAESKIPYRRTTTVKYARSRPVSTTADRSQDPRPAARRPRRTRSNADAAEPSTGPNRAPPTRSDRLPPLIQGDRHKVRIRDTRLCRNEDTGCPDKVAELSTGAVPAGHTIQIRFQNSRSGVNFALPLRAHQSGSYQSRVARCVRELPTPSTAPSESGDAFRLWPV